MIYNMFVYSFLCIQTTQAKYKHAHEKEKGHYKAGGAVDFPDVMRYGEIEKMKNLVRHLFTYHFHRTTQMLTSNM